LLALSGQGMAVALSRQFGNFFVFAPASLKLIRAGGSPPSLCGGAFDEMQLTVFAVIARNAAITADYD